MSAGQSVGWRAERRDLYRRIVETTSEGVWAIDAEHRTTLVNASMGAMLGYSPEEMLGRSMFDFMDEDSARSATRYLERRRSGIGEMQELVLLSKSGERVVTRLTTDPIVGQDGTYEGALALVVDVTAARSQAERESHLWRILDQSLNEIYIVRLSDLRFEYANAGALANLGYSLETLRGMSPLDLAPIHTAESFAESVAPLMDGRQERLDFRGVHRRANGTIYPIDIHLQLAPYKDARVFVAIVNDVTEREEAEAALRRSEARFRALIERNLDLIVLMDKAGKLTFASPSTEAILGISPDELTQMCPLDLIHPDDLQLASAAFERLQSQGEAIDSIVFRARHRDGSYRNLDANARNLIDDPAVSGLVINARDVTDRLRLEEQLRASQKLESVGRLAGGIAHDFNNILTTILGCAALIEEDGAPGPAVLADVHEIKQAAERASELTEQLLAFARKRLISPRSTDPGRLVNDSERFLRRVLGEHIQLSTRLAPALWHIEVDPSQVHQVIVNLAVNARDAMPRGGRLSIEAANVVLDEGSAVLEGDMKAGPHVVLSIVDTGSGIPREVLSQIFEPFFTTKPPGEGTGLGLATVYGIVRQNGGHISVESEVGVGTTFRLYFRRSTAAPDPGAAPHGSKPAARGRERLLVVEDDDLVRTLVVRTLTGAGYTVHAAARPEEALELARSSVFDLLLTDMVMPGCSGKELADRLRASQPGLRVLYMSGYTDDAFAEGGALDEEVQLLPKPFSRADLLARVRGVLYR